MLRYVIWYLPPSVMPTRRHFWKRHDTHVVRDCTVTMQLPERVHLGCVCWSFLMLRMKNFCKNANWIETLLFICLWNEHRNFAVFTLHASHVTVPKWKPYLFVWFLLLIKIYFERERGSVDSVKSHTSRGCLAAHAARIVVSVCVVSAHFPLVCHWCWILFDRLILTCARTSSASFV